MESHELLHKVFKKTPPKQVAAGLGLSVSMVRKWARPLTASGIVNPLDRMEALMECAKDGRLIQWLCGKSGGYFVANAKPAALPPELLPAENETMEKFGELLALIARAVKDGRITPEEAAIIRSLWEELKSVTEGFVVCCEDGNFGQMSKDECRMPNATVADSNQHPPQPTRSAPPMRAANPPC